MNEAIAILTGGGPAPGMNAVVGSVAKTFLQQGYRVIGLHEGYTSLFCHEPRITEIDYMLADAIFYQGGSYLQMSRFKPTDKNFRHQIVERNSSCYFVRLCPLHLVSLPKIIFLLFSLMKRKKL